jgi:hypothetical protein
MTISCPRKALTETHMAAFVDRPITGKTLAKVGVEAFFYCHVSGGNQTQPGGGQQWIPWS